MIWTEIKNQTKSVYELVENELSKRYTFSCDADGVKTYVTSHGEHISLCLMGTEDPWDFFVVEYAETGDDGEGFYPKDYNSFDELMNDIISEIETPPKEIEYGE